MKLKFYDFMRHACKFGAVTILLTYVRAYYLLVVENLVAEGLPFVWWEPAILLSIMFLFIIAPLSILWCVLLFYFGFKKSQPTSSTSS